MIPYDKEQLDNLREKYQATHAIRRRGDDILIFSPDEFYPVDGEKEKINLVENYGIFCFLVKDGIKRHLLSLNRFPIGFYPLVIVSTKPDDNLLSRIVGDNSPSKFLKNTASIPELSIKFLI